MLIQEEKFRFILCRKGNNLTVKFLRQIATSLFNLFGGNVAREKKNSEIHMEKKIKKGVPSPIRRPNATTSGARSLEINNCYHGISSNIATAFCFYQIIYFLFSMPLHYIRNYLSCIEI